MGLLKTADLPTPEMMFTCPCNAASNRYFAVCSKGSLISTPSFIFSTPDLVMPSTYPCIPRLVGLHLYLPAQVYLKRTRNGDDKAVT
jgi:hypothetical protein